MFLTRLRLRFLSILVLILAPVCVADAQPRFEVASVKMAAAPTRVGESVVNEDGQQVVYRAFTLADLLARTYKVEWRRIQGPDWIRTQYYDVAATLPAGAQKDQIPEMVKALLVERFKLTARQELRSTRVRFLEIESGGVKLQRLPQTPNGIGRWGGQTNGLLTAQTMEGLSKLLSSVLDEPVLNKTGLEGGWAIQIRADVASLPGLYIPQKQLDSPVPSPSIQEALKEVGLRLRSATGEVEYLIVDAATRIPTAN